MSRYVDLSNPKIFHIGRDKYGNGIYHIPPDLPTDDAVERKKGEWIKATGMMPPEFHGHHCCSECGNFANMEPPFGNREDLSKFCPNCGADMRERKES